MGAMFRIHQAFSMKRRRCKGLALGALACLAAVCLCSSAFVAPTWRSAPSRSQQVSLVTAKAAGEYTGFVPDMQRRMLMNFVAVAASAVPALVILGGYAYYFFPPIPADGGGGLTVCGDINGNAVSLEGWLKSHRPGQRELVQGIKGEPHYIITDEGDKIKTFALNAVCTHLGCTVPWVQSSNRFICPCHGSQYNEEGKKVRGPAPLSLALAHTTASDGNIAVTPWPETDFRTNTPPS